MAAKKKKPRRKKAAPDSRGLAPGDARGRRPGALRERRRASRRERRADRPLSRPLGGHGWRWPLPVSQVQPTPFSATSRTRMQAPHGRARARGRVMIPDRSGRPDSRRSRSGRRTATTRLTALKRLGAKTVIALVSPDPRSPTASSRSTPEGAQPKEKSLGRCACTKPGRHDGSAPRASSRSSRGRLAGDARLAYEQAAALRRRRLWAGSRPATSPRLGIERRWPCARSAQRSCSPSTSASPCW